MADEKALPAMTRHVRNVWGRDDQLPELIEHAEAVERMMESSAWIAVSEVLGAEVATIDRELDHGHAKEAVEYAKKHGQRSALGAAGDAARAIISEAARRRSDAERDVQASGAGESAPGGTG